jgi:hypothetical protein
MTKIKANKLPLGLYKILWKEGGASLAAVGEDDHGNRWFAPSNWLHVPSFDWRIIKKAVFLCSGTDCGV